MANTSKGVLFLPPSDAYVRSFLYLLYTLIKLLKKKKEMKTMRYGLRHTINALLCICGTVKQK